MFGQTGSLAAASPKFFETEPRLIFDRLIQEIEKAHPDDEQVEAAVADLKKRRAVFVEEVGRTAQLVMDQALGARHQGWKGQLASAGTTPEQIKEFSERKRYLRLIRLGCDPEEAHKIVKDDTQYRKFILLREKGHSKLKTFFIMKRGLKAYKKTMRAG